MFCHKFHQPLAAFDMCILNKGAFALEIVWGDSEMDAYRRVTLSRGGRNSRYDCIQIAWQNGI